MKVLVFVCCVEMTPVKRSPDAMSLAEGNAEPITALNGFYGNPLYRWVCCVQISINNQSSVTELINWILGNMDWNKFENFYENLLKWHDHLVINILIKWKDKNRSCYRMIKMFLKNLVQNIFLKLRIGVHDS